MQNCPGDGCFRANSRHWMRWIYEYTPLTKQTVLGVLFVLALIVAIGISLIFLLALAAFTADEEMNHRERRNERDLDMRRRWP